LVVFTKPLNDALQAATGARAAFRALLNSLGIADPRVRILTGLLRLDKSTASRLGRGLRAADGATTLREFPASEGLAAVVAACARRGAPSVLQEAATNSIQALEEAVRALPGGRSGLATALAGAAGAPTEPGAASGTVRRSRRGAERTARRAAVNAACFLQGIRVDASVHGLILAPGSKPETLHQGMIHSLVGMRRLRPGPPITVAGVYGSPLTTEAPTRLCLSGRPIGEDPREVLMREFCDGPVDRLRVEKRDRSYLLWLDREDPPLDQPATVTYGMKYVDFVERVKSERFHHTCTAYTLRRPTYLFVVEVMVAPGLLAPGGPRLRITMDPQRTPDPIGGPPADGREELEQNSAFVPLGRGFDEQGGAAAEPYVPIMRHAMEELGWNPSEFERYQLIIEYPLAFLGMQVWFGLADGPVVVNATA
jgi:hypothetical protein